MAFSLLKQGDIVFIHDTEISNDGLGVIKQLCKMSMTVVFIDTGLLGIYSFNRNYIGLKSKRC